MHDKNTVRKLSLNEYLTLRSLQSPVSDFMIDKLRIPHGLTKRQEDKLMHEADKARNDYSEQRNAAIRDYEDLVKQGKITIPSPLEVCIRNAQGHPDNASVQASKRMLEKRLIKKITLYQTQTVETKKYKNALQYVMSELLPEVQRMNTNFIMCICLDNEGNLSRVISNFGKMNPEEMIREALQVKTDSVYFVQASFNTDVALEEVKDFLEQCQFNGIKVLETYLYDKSIQEYICIDDVLQDNVLQSILKL